MNRVKKVVSAGKLEETGKVKIHKVDGEVTFRKLLPLSKASQRPALVADLAAECSTVQ